MSSNKMVPAFIGLAMIAPASFAQSSVTLYGIVDQAVRTVKSDGVGGTESLANGGNATSRIGFRGTEELGGGFAAGFVLEGGIAADTGASIIGTQFFDRGAYVNLKSQSLGEIRLGHDLTPGYIVWGTADPFNQVGIGSVVSLYPAASSNANNPIRTAFGTNDRNASTTGRSNNMVTYFTPSNLGGFNGTISLAPKEGATGVPTPTTAHGYKAFTAGYVKGPISVRVGYALTRTSNLPGETFKDLDYHGIYDFGFAKASIAQRQYKFRTSRENLLQLGMWVPAGPSGTIKASYGLLDNRGTVGATAIDSIDVRMLGLGYQYDMSKRTALYATAAFLKNSSGSSVFVPGGSGTGFAAGGKSRGFEAGIRHNF